MFYLLIDEIMNYIYIQHIKIKHYFQVQIQQINDLYYIHHTIKKSDQDKILGSFIYTPNAT